MNHFVNHIEDDVLAQFEQFINLGLHNSYLDGGRVDFNIETNIIECKKIAIPISGINEYLIIECEWLGDTPKHALDLRELLIKLEKKPTFLEIEEIQHKGHDINKISNSIGLSLFEREEVITAIEIFRYRESCEEESVDYDMGIAFHCGPKLLVISAELSIRGGLIIANSNKAYEKLQSECSIRKKWSSQK